MAYFPSQMKMQVACEMGNLKHPCMLAEAIMVPNFFIYLVLKSAPTTYSPKNMILKS